MFDFYTLVIYLFRYKIQIIKLYFWSLKRYYRIYLKCVNYIRIRYSLEAHLKIVEFLPHQNLNSGSPFHGLDKNNKEDRFHGGAWHNICDTWQCEICGECADPPITYHMKVAHPGELLQSLLQHMYFRFYIFCGVLELYYMWGREIFLITFNDYRGLWKTPSHMIW